MDWELYERQRATLVFISVAVFCFSLLAFQRSVAVQHVKAFFVGFTFPTQRLFSQLAGHPPADKPIVPIPQSEDNLTPPQGAVDMHAEQSRAVHVLSDENTRLRALLDLKRERWPKLISAHIVSRDPQRWFQELLLDKGGDDGVHVDEPVIAITGNREALIGRIVEAGSRSARVMLIHDSLSAVPARVSGANDEDGVVEGSNSHDLYLKYLSRESKVKLGDMVVTSGLGKTFPEGIPIGWVQEIGVDQRGLFLQARLNPAIMAHSMHLVGVLTRDNAAR
jgi:rod shape-determining protein MreC